PQSSGRLYLLDWKEEFLDVSQQVPPGTWFSGLAQNQSLAGAAQRLFRYGIPLSLEAARSAKLAAGDVPLLRATVYGASLVLLGITTIVFVTRRRPAANRGGRSSDDERLCYAAEISADFALMVLLSSMTRRS